ncbi:uncharacterized protein LALA0_S07e02278g [Lachancea lanzarotensis]|uniref:LALA0S07e02278g1_1 n=1 Tax=Lachancea lanzarotensis TaxID=1245769 RepID=A0A0C7N9A1_9SACH|nr:uncharacterized protein LALA0_S07e02278g [Lachancea lanzarotensis]CEP63095.1 LALA0S07e02278g1_1 [Lachancea lanzarotensis]
MTRPHWPTLNEKMESREASNVEDRIPSKCFRSVTSWRIYEWSRWRPFQIALPVLLLMFFVISTLIIFSAQCVLDKVLEYYLLCVGLFPLSRVMSFILKRRKIALVEQQKVELFRRIMTQRPGLNLTSWDSLAVDINEYLNQEQLWNTPWFFFNGASLQHIFRSFLYLPLKDGKFDNDAEIMLLLDATVAYENSVHNPEQSSEKSEQIFGGALGNGKLPRDSYRFKIAWFIALEKMQLVITGLAVACCYIFFNNGALFGAILPLAVSLKSFIDRGANMPLDATVKFMEAVDFFEPGEDGSIWDEIALKMNCEFKSQRKHMRDVFFDGENCRQMFRSKMSSIIADRKPRMPELISFAHELNVDCGWSDEDKSRP